MRSKGDSQIFAMIPVKNEAQRYLAFVLNRLAPVVTAIVILDDASTDNTPDLCRSHPKVVRYHRLNEPLFLKNEAVFRSLLWTMTIELNPGWIMALDADEFPEKGLKHELPDLTGQTQADLIRFPICHFWGNLDCYRVDGMWNPLLYPTACLYRYKKDRVYHWTERRLHCGRFPVEAYQGPALTGRTRLLHLGYADREEHRKKYHRYLQADPKGRYCPVEHYKSILDPCPQLRRWHGEKLEVCP